MVICLLGLSSCQTGYGDTQTKKFHITEIVIKSDFARSCVVSCAKARKATIPNELRTKLSNALHHYAAAYNQIQSGARLNYRLEVSVVGLSYENCSTAARVLATISGGFFSSGGSIIISESKLIDPNTGATIREFSNSKQKMNILGCSVESQNNAYAKNMSEFILRRANLNKSTPASIEQSLANVDILQPRIEPLSPNSIASANLQPVGIDN